MRALAVGAMYPPHDLGGGYEITWRSSVRHLRARGDEVRVLAGDFRAPDPDGPEDPDVHRELRLYWRDHDFPRLSWRERIALERHNAAVLARHVEEFRPDVLCWWQLGGTSIALVEHGRRAGLPAVGVIGDDWMGWGPRLDGWLSPFRSRPRLARLAERATGLPARVDFGGAAEWLFNSEHTRRRALAAAGPLPRTAVAHPGVDTALFRPAPEPDGWRWRLLYLGRLDERKGVHLAVEALASWPAETVLTLQGAGDAGYVEQLRRRAEALGVPERLRFSSAPRAEIPRVYAEADAVLFPVQWAEPWGLVPLEAMAVGRPVVATGTGGSGEYMRHEDNCLLIDPADSADALAGAVTRLAGDAALRGRLRESGLRTAAPFTEEAYNDAIAAALDAAAGVRASAPR
ncbi:MAG: glycogen synthase [Thermoleophilaceae bacterium]|nr:glycogen synthase [Thermoleophilaceae bacterium]